MWIGISLTNSQGNTNDLVGILSIDFALKCGLIARLCTGFTLSHKTVMLDAIFLGDHLDFALAFFIRTLSILWSVCGLSGICWFRLVSNFAKQRVFFLRAVMTLDKIEGNRALSTHANMQKYFRLINALSRYWTLFSWKFSLEDIRQSV